MEKIQQKIQAIQDWYNYWKENTVYGILSREIYKMAGRNKNVSSNHNNVYRKCKNHYQLVNQLNFNSYWGENYTTFSAYFKSHRLLEHFTLENYDNPLGAKIDEILGSFSQASYTPRLIYNRDIIMPEFASIMRDRLDLFLNNEENKNAFLRCVDSILCAGYAALKINYRQKANFSVYKEKEIYIEQIPYQEMVFFSPYALTTTKSDTFFQLPTNYCGVLHRVERKHIKQKYKNILKGEEPTTLSFSEKDTPIYGLLKDNRDTICIAEYYNYSSDGKVERTLFCGNYILEESTFDWDFLPIVYVDGNSSYTSDIQQVFSLFDKALTVQKQLNVLNNRIAYLVRHTKSSTFAFTNKFALSEKNTNKLNDVSDSPYIVYEQSTMGIDEQLPPVILQTIELPQTLLVERDSKIQFLDQMMRGYYDTNDSNFGESGRALELKQQNKSSLFARQLSSLSNAIKKITEMYKKMFFFIYSNNINDSISDYLQSFGSFENYISIMCDVNFDVVIDPNVSLSKEVTRRAIAEALQYMPEEVMRQIFTKEYIKNMQIPDPAALLKDLEVALEEQKRIQEEQANKPDPAIVASREMNESHENIANLKAKVDLEKSREKNIAQIAMTAMKTGSDQEDRQLKFFEIMRNTDAPEVKKESVNEN